MIKNLGLAYRAGKIVLGTDAVIDRLRKNELFLVILANDASDNTKKKINDKCKTYETKVLMDFNAEQISKSLGKSDVKVLGITDRGFASLII